MTLPNYAAPLQRFADEIVAWNDAAGKYPSSREASVDELLNQEARVVEELNELIHAMDEGDLTETLDAVCDIFVTASYYLALTKTSAEINDDYVLPPGQQELIMKVLKELASDETRPEGRTREVLRDNKFVSATLRAAISLVRDLPVDFLGAQQAVNDNNASKYVESQEVADASVAHYASKGEEVKAHESSYLGRKVFVLKRTSDDKIMKPVGFVGVELSPFIYS